MACFPIQAAAIAKLETPVPVRTLKLATWATVSTWMGDHVQRLDVDAVSYKYCKIPEALKRGLHYMLLGQKQKQTK